MADQPSGDEVVVISVQIVFAPALGLETLEEIVALQDTGAVGPRPARHARGAAVYVVRGGNLKVPALDVCRA